MSSMKSDVNTVFAKRLKELRLEKKLTQVQLAEMLLIRQQSYIRYEYGTGEPDLETLVRLARIFNVSVDFLLGLSDY